MSIDKKINYEDQRLTEKQKKTIKPANQGGGPNYLGKQETVTVPKKWLSDPDHVVAELAYITPREQKILLNANLYGSLKGKPNRGPGGIMSLQGDLGGFSSSTGGKSGDSSGKGGGGSSSYKDTNYYKMMTGTGTTATSPTGDTYRSGNIEKGAVPEYVNTPTGPKYVGSQFKSYGQRNFFGDLFSGGAPGYRSTYGTRPNFFERTLGFGNQTGSINTRINPNTGQLEYYSEDEKVGDVKPGIGGRVLGGILSLITGVPFVGSIIGNAIDKYKPKSMYDDMSQYNRLGLFGADPVLTDNYSNMKISDTSFSPTNQPLFDVNKIKQMIENARSLPGNNLRTEVTQQDINASKMRGFNIMDRQTAIDLGMISPNVTEYEFEQLKQGNITQPGTYVGWTKDRKKLKRLWKSLKRKNWISASLIKRWRVENKQLLSH